MDAKEMNEIRAARRADLIGSEEQCKWADKIRKDMIENFNTAKLAPLQTRLIKFYARRGIDFSADTAEIYEEIKNNKSATFWINDARSAGSMAALVKSIAYSLTDSE